MDMDIWWVEIGRDKMSDKGRFFRCEQGKNQNRAGYVEMNIDERGKCEIDHLFSTSVELFFYVFP